MTPTIQQFGIGFVVIILYVVLCVLPSIMAIRQAQRQR